MPHGPTGIAEQSLTPSRCPDGRAVGRGVRTGPESVGDHPLLDLQRRAGNAVTAAAVRAPTSSLPGHAADPEQTAAPVQRQPPISERLRPRPDDGKRRSSRLNPGRGSTGRGFKPPIRRRARGIWDGSARYTYNPNTWTTVLGKLQTQGQGKAQRWECPQCNQWLPRYVFKKPHQNGITLDHKTDYKRWIWSTAAPNEAGEITTVAAKAAYNDTANLQGMCRDCNSSKNGPRDG